MSRTRECFGAFVPDCGLCATTNPRGSCEGTLKTAGTRPARLICAIASSRLRPTTFGTATRCGPRETESATVPPFSTAVPAAGCCVTTRPGAAEAKITRCRDFNPAACSRLTATAIGIPTTFGAASFGFPPETVSATVPPCERRASPWGAWATTMPFRFELDAKRTSTVMTRPSNDCTPASPSNAWSFRLSLRTSSSFLIASQPRFKDAFHKMVWPEDLTTLRVLAHPVRKLKVSDHQ